jgi:DNA invertase Pin-like site-specific DNA recombinase
VLDLQRDALIAAGVKRSPLYEDKASGEKDDRPPVWRPASRHCARVILSSSGSSIASAANMDTTTASGRLVFGIFATLAEFECELIRERTIAGSLRRVPVTATAAVPIR